MDVNLELMKALRGQGLRWEGIRLRQRKKSRNKRIERDRDKETENKLATRKASESQEQGQTSFLTKTLDSGCGSVTLAKNAHFCLEFFLLGFHPVQQKIP